MCICKWKKIIDKYYITSKYINSLKRGDVIRFVFIGRGLCCYTRYLKKRGFFHNNMPEDPCKILNGIHYHGIYIHGDKLKGKIKYLFEGCKSNSSFKEFEFDVEVTKNTWIALKNRKLDFTSRSTLKRYKGNDDLYIMKNVKVGVCGPIILEKDVKNLPYMYLN